jgi:hypothetical protein
MKNRAWLFLFSLLATTLVFSPSPSFAIEWQMSQACPSDGIERFIYVRASSTNNTYTRLQTSPDALTWSDFPERSWWTTGLSDWYFSNTTDTVIYCTPGLYFRTFGSGAQMSLKILQALPVVQPVISWSSDAMLLFSALFGVVIALAAVAGWSSGVRG